MNFKRNSSLDLGPLSAPTPVRVAMEAELPAPAVEMLHLILAANDPNWDPHLSERLKVGLDAELAKDTYPKNPDGSIDPEVWKRAACYLAHTQPGLLDFSNADDVRLHKFFTLAFRPDGTMKSPEEMMNDCGGCSDKIHFSVPLKEGAEIEPVGDCETPFSKVRWRVL